MEDPPVNAGPAAKAGANAAAKAGPTFTDKLRTAQKVNAGERVRRAELRELVKDNVTFSRNLRAAAEDGAGHVSHLLREHHFPIKPSRGTDFFFNLLLHIIVLFAALTFLFIFVVSKEERGALQGEFVKLINDNMPTQLENADTSSGGALKPALLTATPVLEVMIKQNSKPDEATQIYNDSLMTYAILYLGIMLVGFAFAMWALQISAGIPMWSTLGHVLLENGIVFLIVGAIEFCFFWFIAKHYIAVKPSTLMTSLVTDIQNAL